MTEQQVGLLVIQSLASMGLLAYLGVLLLKKREEREKFRLYAIRDRLVYLSATGELPQGNMVFRVFYQAVNISISEANTLTVSSLIRASVKAKTALQQEKQEKLMESIQRASPEVRSVVEDFAVVMRDIVYSNSFGLRMFVQCARFVKFLADRISAPPKPQGYETYVYWRDMHDRVCPA